MRIKCIGGILGNLFVDMKNFMNENISLEHEGRYGVYLMKPCGNEYGDYETVNYYTIPFEHFYLDAISERYVYNKNANVFEFDEESFNMLKSKEISMKDHILTRQTNSLYITIEQ